MNLTDEFKKYATKERGINSLYYDKIIASMTPYIMEERQLNVAQMDVFSRLMMDRIIFLGTDVNDQVANIITAQLLFLESVDSGKDIQIYINSPGGSVYAGFRYLRHYAIHQTRCSYYLYRYGSLYVGSFIVCRRARKAFSITSLTRDDTPTIGGCTRSCQRYGNQLERDVKN